MTRVGAILKCVFRHSLFKCAVSFALALCVALSSGGEFGRLEAATHMSLNYENAAKGLYPNSTRFNMYDVISEDIARKVVDRMGLSDYISAYGLVSRLSVAPRYTRRASERYIGTEFTISLSLSKRIGNASAEDILKMVCLTYFEDFAGRFADNAALEGFSVSGLNDLDYDEIARVFETRSSQLGNYIDRRRIENGVFRSENTSETFASLQKRLENFTNVTCDKYKSFITEMGLTRDYDSRVAELNYHKKLLEREYLKNYAQYELRLEAVALYDVDQTAIAMIPTYGANNEFYMSKTAIGMDYMASDARNYLSAAADMRGDIQLEELNLERLITARESDVTDSVNHAESMIGLMEQEFNSIITDTIKTDDDYIDYTLSKALSFHPRGVAFTEEYSVKKALPAFALAYALITLLETLARDYSKKRKGRGELLPNSKRKGGR